MTGPRQFKPSALAVLAQKIIDLLKSEATTLYDAKGLISSLGMRAYALIIIKRTQDTDIRLTVSKAYPFQ